MILVRTRLYLVLLIAVIVAVPVAVLALDVSTKEIVVPAFLAFFAINLWYALLSRKRGENKRKQDWLEDVILTIVAVTSVYFLVRRFL